MNVNEREYQRVNVDLLSKDRVNFSIKSLLFHKLTQGKGKINRHRLYPGTTAQR